MLKSRTVRALLAPLTWLIFIATLVCLNHKLVEDGDLPRSAHIGGEDSYLAPMTLTSFALSLLLVFRTNSSYGRFDEARKMWGLMLNRSRDIVRMALAYFPETDPRGSKTTERRRRWGAGWERSRSR